MTALIQLSRAQTMWFWQDTHRPVEIASSHGTALLLTWLPGALLPLRCRLLRWTGLQQRTWKYRRFCVFQTRQHGQR